MKPLYESVKEEKSKADEMFKELGYDRREELYGKSLLTIKYYNLGNLPDITFDKQKRTVRTSENISVSLLQAINEKCKELKWI